MWGNRRGWAIALFMLFVMVASVATAYVISSRRTEPTEFTKDAANLAAIELPIDPRTVLPVQSNPGDAGGLYWSAVEDYAKQPDKYDAMTRVFNLGKAVALPGVVDVVSAGDYQKATIFDGRTDAAVGYGTQPGVGALHKIGGIAARIGTEYANKKQYADGRKYLNATFVLGYRLYQERMTRLQLSAALGLMAHSSKVLSQIAVADNDKAQADKLDEFYSAYQSYYKDRIEPMERVLTSIDPIVQSRHVGDVFAISENSDERVWRVESALKLGMYKFNTNTAGDRRAAIRKVKSLLSDRDPAIATAAAAADGLTIEQYRTLGGK